MNGDIAEMVIYSRKLSMSEVAGTEAYLTNHWAI
jgi:hypothetical protein